MILTTNRTTTIDPAFESRIDITLAYKNLTKEARKEVWTNFLQRLGSLAELSDGDITELAGFPLNGRQIKSATKTASMMAASQGCPLRLRHLRIVIELRSKAAKLLNSGSEELVLGWEACRV